jgi:hypothetical protein
MLVEGNLRDFIDKFSVYSEDVKRLLKSFILSSFQTLELTLKDRNKYTFEIDYYTYLDEVKIESILYKYNINDTYCLVYPDNISVKDIERLIQNIENDIQFPT